MTAREGAEALAAAFEAGGATRVDVPLLQPAGPLLDLYGEEMRARAYVTSDPLRGEMMLRPDFTVPVASRHIGAGGGAARHCYAGLVFRRQEVEADRPIEYAQAGLEIFGEAGPQADAEVLSSIIAATPGARATLGDLGVIRAALSDLPLSPARHAALMRHLWRPGRFAALLDRYAGPPRPVPDRPVPRDVPGLRTRAQIEARLDALRADAAEPPLPVALRDGIAALLAVDAPAPRAPARLLALSATFPALGRAADALSARLDAMSGAGLDPAAMDFRADHGRTTMAYYDGGTFSLTYPGAAQPVALGGRYDALCARLGADLPAVGGAIRPGLMEGRP
ncbi:MAG: ATP phosphoribosyltransferase regulatory subunit [Paracoccaceae bacterium]